MRYKKDIVYIGLGANLRQLPYTNTIKMLESVKKKLFKLDLRIIDSSNYWQTYPMPFANIPKFINCVVKCLIVKKKANNPHVLLENIKNLELEIGRKKKNFDISRVIDIDIIDYKREIVNDDLILPHPRMHSRKFVLLPMKTIAKNWKPIFTWLYKHLERRKKIALGVDASYRDTELYLSHFQTFAANQKLFIDLCKRPDKRVMLVIDEAHYIKGIDKVWSSAMLNVAPYANSRVILTGTPAPNGYEDLKNLFDFIHPKKNILGFNISQLNRMSKGKTSVSPLNEKAKSFFTRITKKNLDIPEPIFTVKAIQMSPKQERIYTLINSKVANNRKQRKLFMNANLIRLRQAASNPMILTEPIEEELYGANINDELMTAQSLQEIASQVKEFNNDDDLPKLQALLDEVKTAKEKNERILIWTYFIKNVELIHRHLVKNLSDIDINVITGATPVEKSDVHFDPNHELTREKTLEKFRANKPSVLLATPHCIGESISLHKHCHKAIYYDRDYNCGLFIQSKDRIHRFGLTKNDITEYIFLVSKDTIDEIIANTLNDKETRMIDMLESDEIPLLAEEDEETIQLNIINKIIESYHERQL